VFSYSQAQIKARTFFDQKVREISGNYVGTGKFTVADAMGAYLEKYVRRGGKDVGRINSASRSYILPVLGEFPVAKLTRQKLEQWHHDNSISPARLRGRKGQQPNLASLPQTPEAKRRRAASANRVLTILKAALNDAYNDGRISTNEAWHRVRAFRQVDAARIRYLSDAEARKLVDASPEDFRSLVIGALMTGCRYSELAAPQWCRILTPTQRH
jgi:integrase